MSIILETAVKIKNNLPGVIPCPVGDVYTESAINIMKNLNGDFFSEIIKEVEDSYLSSKMTNRFNELTAYGIFVTMQSMGVIKYKSSGVYPSEDFEEWDDLIKTLKSKGEDYSDPNIDPFMNMRFCEEFGVSTHIAIMVRMADKITRINRLLSKNLKNSVKDESIMDTYADLLGYFVILVSLIIHEVEQ